MPIRELACVNPDCPAVGVRREWFQRTQETPNPVCQCGWQFEQKISRFSAIWTRNIEAYGSKNKETYYQDQARGGHWFARKRSGGGTEDKPKWEFIDSVQKQRSVCREEGVIPPDQLPSTMDVSDDGMSAKTQGLPGSWV